MALLDNLLSYFKLDEASGNALDAHGTNDLTDTNTVGSTTGKLSNARDFIAANSEVLLRANSLNITADFSIQLWIKPDTVSVVQVCLARRGDLAFNTINYLIYLDNDRLRFFVGFTDSSFLEIVTPVASIATGTWHHVVCTHDDTAEETKIYLNNAAPVSGTYSGKTLATTALDSFRIGSQYSGNPLYYDGAIDEVGVWDRVLTASEVEDLYNSGSGLTYENFTPPPGATPPKAVLGITAYAPTATGDPTLFEYISAATTSSPTASTSIEITSTPPIGANLALLLISCDNSGSGADGDYSQVTGVTDNKGNSWHKIAEHSNTNGSPNSGTTVSAWYCEVDPNTFSSTITTATFSSSIAGRNAAMVYCRSETLSLYAAEILTAATDASTSYGLLSTSLAAKNRMYVRACAQDSDTSSGFTPTTGFTGVVTNVQAGSGANQGLRAELKIATSAAETSNPTSSFSSNTASVFIALEADAAGGDADHTAINTYSMTGVSDAADEVTQITAVSVGVNSSTTADEVTQITAVSLGINVSAEDEVTQIVMYSITSQPIPVPPTTVLGLTTFAPVAASGSIGSITVPTAVIGLTPFAPTITASQVANIEVPIVEIGYTAFAPDPPTLTSPTATSTPTATPSSTPTSTPTTTPSATPTSTPTGTPSSTPTSTPTGTSSCTPTASSSTSTSASISASGTNTSSASASFSASSSASCSATTTPSGTTTGTPTSTPSGTATGTPTSTPSGTPTGTPTSTPSGTPTTTATGTEEPPPDFDCCCCCSPIPGVVVIVIIR